MSKLNSNFVANAFAQITFKMHTKLVHVSQKMKRDCVCIFICAHVYATPKLENWNNSKKKVLEEIIMAIDNYLDGRKKWSFDILSPGPGFEIRSAFTAINCSLQFTGNWWFRKKDRYILGQLESVDDWILELEDCAKLENFPMERVIGRFWVAWIKSPKVFQSKISRPNFLAAPWNARNF